MGRNRQPGEGKGDEIKLAVTGKGDQPIAPARATAFIDSLPFLVSQFRFLSRRITSTVATSGTARELWWRRGLASRIATVGGRRFHLGSHTRATGAGAIGRRQNHQLLLPATTGSGSPACGRTAVNVAVAGTLSGDNMHDMG
jgi:hypothetical protein